MKQKLFVAAAACAALALTQDAEARDFADIYTDCGLGALIAPNNEAVAAVTNVTWDLGTTAISSNASSPDTCNGGGAKSAALIYRTYPELERDIANGQGEHLDALVALLRVEAADEFVATLRPALAELVAADGYTESTREAKAAALYDAVQAAI